MYKVIISAFLVLNFSSEKLSNPVDISSQCIFADADDILSFCHRERAASIKEMIIRDDKSYKEYGARIRAERSGCESAFMPEIDFTKSTLVAKITKRICCRASYKRRILKDSINRKVIYEIMVDYEGTCSKRCVNYNWALIPKIPEDYTVEFLVNKKYQSDTPGFHLTEMDSLQFVCSDKEGQLDSLSKIHLIVKREMLMAKTELHIEADSAGALQIEKDSLQVVFSDMGGQLDSIRELLIIVKEEMAKVRRELSMQNRAVRSQNPIGPIYQGLMRKWNFLGYMDSSYHAKPSVIPDLNIQFDESGRFMAKISCNSTGGSYQLTSNGSLKLNGEGITEVYCVKEKYRDKWFSIYSSGIGSVEKYQIYENKLELMISDGRKFIFEATRR